MEESFEEHPEYRAIRVPDGFEGLFPEYLRYGQYLFRSEDILMEEVVRDWTGANSSKWINAIWEMEKGEMNPRTDPVIKWGLERFCSRKPRRRFYRGIADVTESDIKSRHVMSCTISLEVAEKYASRGVVIEVEATNYGYAWELSQWPGEAEVIVVEPYKFRIYKKVYAE